MAETAIIALTRAGVQLAQRLGPELTAMVWAPARFAGEAPDAQYYTTIHTVVQTLWQRRVDLVFIAATGIAVRLIAPFLSDKATDPAVVSLDEQGRFVVPLAGGHRAGANALARRIAAITGGQAAITTASDTQGLPALDLIGREAGWRIASDSATTHVMACLVNGELIGVWVDPLLPAVREYLAEALASAPALEWVDDPDALSADQFAAVIIVSPRRLSTTWERVRHKGVRYLPPVLVAGMGCRRGVTVAELTAALTAALRDADLLIECLAALATVDLKADEPALGALASRLGVPLRIFTADQVRALDPTLFSASAAARFDLPGVAEPCAMLAAEGGPMLVTKRSFAQCTVAVAAQQRKPGRLPPAPQRGRLTLVSIGPGDLQHLTIAARAAIMQAEVVTGYHRYIELIRPLLRPTQDVIATPAMGNEMERAQEAIALAQRGQRVALISSGDVGIYAMAAPVFESLRAVGWDGAQPEVEVAPGVSAFQALAARLGAPINHDLCLISLSDLLTPWPLIERRLHAAAQADFVIALYNPRSQGRHWQLAAAFAIVREHRPPETPVAFGRQVTRPDEQITVTTLAEADPAQADMLTLVLIGNSQSFQLAGRVVTPRGYTTTTDIVVPSSPGEPAGDYPIVLSKPSSLPAVVIGGGAVGERKVRGLLAAGIPVRLISPTATAQLAAWAAEGRLHWERRVYQAGDLAGARLVFAATNDRAVNARIAAAASAIGALCNVADASAEGDFHVPAIHRSGGITVAVSSVGAAPARASAIRDAIASWLEMRGDDHHER